MVDLLSANDGFVWSFGLRRRLHRRRRRHRLRSSVTGWRRQADRWSRDLVKEVGEEKEEKEEDEEMEKDEIEMDDN